MGKIFNSCERLKYMQTLPRDSLKSSYFYQIERVLADIETRADNFMIKRIPRGFGIFIRKKKDAMFLFLYYLLGLDILETIK